jgi:glycine/D-amino acid oxidase-like deaminating enzyme
VTNYERSPWLDNFPTSRVPSHPKYKGAAQTGVVVVGAGLTGCLTAYALAAAGVKVIVLETDRIGYGATAFASGWISEDPNVPFDEVAKAIGLRAARRAWNAWRRAALDFAALLKRLDVKCRLEERGSVTLASTPAQMLRLRKDLKARRDAGLDAPLLTGRTIKRDLALDAEAGLRTRAGGTIDPYRATIGIAAAAIERGAQFFERSPVRRLTFTRKTLDVIAEGGTIRAERVVIATGLPRALFKALARHFWFHTSYFALTAPIPAKIRQALGVRAAEPPRAIVRDSAAPPHTIRWVDDDRLLVNGADSEIAPPRQRRNVIVQRTGQLMYELSTLYPDISGVQPSYGWAADYARTADGLPFIGSHRNYPFHLFAFGDSSHSVTGSYLASRVILRQYSGEMDPADASFGFHR